MGWADDQAARAREQQRQAYQRAASAKRAEEIRQENTARSQQAYRKQQESFFRQNEEKRKTRAAADEADRKKGHETFMRNMRETAANTQQSSWSPSASSRRHKSESYPTAPTSKSGGGSKAAWVILLIVGFGIYAANHSNKSRPASSEPTQTEMPASQPQAEPTKPSPQIAEPPQQAKPREQAPAAPEPAPAPQQIQQPNSPLQFEATGQSRAPTVAEVQQTVPAPQPQMPLEAISRVSPIYPPIARQAGMQGVIGITVYVAPNGYVASAIPDGGNPILVQTAVSAARRWRFAPFVPQGNHVSRPFKIYFNFGQEQ